MHQLSLTKEPNVENHLFPNSKLCLVSKQIHVSLNNKKNKKNYLMPPTTAPFLTKYPSFIGLSVLALPAELDRISVSLERLPPSLSVLPLLSAFSLSFSAGGLVISSLGSCLLEGFTYKQPSSWNRDFLLTQLTV